MPFVHEVHGPVDGRAVPVPRERQLEVGLGVRAPEGPGEGADVEAVQYDVHLGGDAFDRPVAVVPGHGPRQRGERRAHAGGEPELYRPMGEVAAEQGQAVAVAAGRAQGRRPERGGRRARPQRNHRRPGNERGQHVTLLARRGHRNGGSHGPAGDGVHVDGQRRADLDVVRSRFLQGAEDGAEPAVAPARVVPAHVQLVGGPCGGDVEQALVLGGLLRAVPLHQVRVVAGPPTAAACADLPVEGEGDALLGAPPDGVPAPAGRGVGLRDEDDGELQALCAVDREQAHGVRGVQDGLAFARFQVVPPPADVADELVRGVAGERARQVDELPYVGKGLVAALQRGPGRLETRSGQGPFR